MSGWSMCRCGKELGRSTFRQVVDGVHQCYCCGIGNEPNVTRDEATLDLVERLERLEEQMDQLRRPEL